MFRFMPFSAQSSYISKHKICTVNVSLKDYVLPYEEWISQKFQHLFIHLKDRYLK